MFLKNGSPLAIEPQVFDLLHLLADNAGKLITKDQLVEIVWGGRIVSDTTISARINAARSAVGDTGKAQAVIRTIPRSGIELVVSVETSGAASETKKADHGQTIHVTTSADGTQLADAMSGSGPKIMRAGHFLTHLERDRNSLVWAPYLDALSSNHTLVRYDQRGTGLSSRVLTDSSVAAYSADLLAVADAAGMDRFPLIASSQGVPVSIYFAAHHPERLTLLVLF